MRKLFFSHAAEQDVTELWAYIALKNPAAADLVTTEIETALQRLCEQPSAGHLRPDLTSAPVRFWTVRNYLVVYRFDEKALHVVRVLSGYRDVAALLP